MKEYRILFFMTSMVGKVLQNKRLNSRTLGKSDTIGKRSAWICERELVVDKSTGNL